MFKHWILVTAVVAVVGCNQADRVERDDDAEEQEARMPFDQAPPAVRDALTREAQGATIDSVEHEVENGRNVYEAKVAVGGENWEIEVDESGKVLEKERADD